MTEPDVSSLLTVDQAIALIDATEVPPPRIMRSDLRHALGLRLAQTIVADRDFPAFDKSQMDGFAVRAVDLVGAPTELRVVDEIAAGRAATRPLAPGEAMAIM